MRRTEHAMEVPEDEAEDEEEREAEAVHKKEAKVYEMARAANHKEKPVQQEEEKEDAEI